MKKKTVVLLAAWVFLVSEAGAQNRKSVVSFFGGIHHHYAFGDVSEYIPGENDFPVTPAHTPVLAGVSYAVAGRLGFEVEARFIGSTKVLLEDPSDGDTIEVAAGPHVSLGLNVFYQPFFGSIRPYLSAGGGLDAILSKDAVYTSKYGYPIAVPAPQGKEKFDPELHAGGGFFIDITKRLGLRLDVRYVWILDDPQSVRGVQAAAGLFLAF